ncbi:MAG: DUF6106 family protein [Lachnospiraceae bacterium]|nr:DUF6106 family protein [Lachnospiraceae bacterium]
MNDTYVEVMVARKKNPLLYALKIFLYALAVACFLMAMIGYGLFFIVTAVSFLVAYFVLPYFDLEYEYLYIDREISIDKIMSKEKRKHVYTVDLNRMAIMAPAGSHELDQYRSRGLKTYDFSSRIDGADVYTIVYEADREGTVLVNIEPNEEMLRAVSTVFPRKLVR